MMVSGSLFLREIHTIPLAALCVVVIGLMATLAHGEAESGSSAGGDESKVSGKATPSESLPGTLARSVERSAIRALIEQETIKTSLPADIAEAVVFVESSYDASTVGRVGEIGLMQVRPETAAMMGFSGSTAELATPELNIHYGVMYLSQAWRLARGDLCRTLMKYRAGHGEEIMSPLSVKYCDRARSRLAAMGSLYAGPGTLPTFAAPPVAGAKSGKSSSHQLIRPTDVYSIYRRGTLAASRSFWTIHEARVRAMSARIESKWRRAASR